MDNDRFANLDRKSYLRSRSRHRWEYSHLPWLPTCRRDSCLFGLKSCRSEGCLLSRSYSIYMVIDRSRDSSKVWSFPSPDTGFPSQYIVLPSSSSLKAVVLLLSSNRSTNPMVLLQVAERYPPVLSFSLVMNHEFIIIKVLFFWSSLIDISYTARTPPKPQHPPHFRITHLNGVSTPETTDPTLPLQNWEDLRGRLLLSC